MQQYGGFAQEANDILICFFAPFLVIANIHVWFCTPGYWIYIFTALSTLTLTSCSYVLVAGLSLWS